MYFAVQYIWMVLLYCIFMGVFVLVGGGIGLKIFTMNSYSVQVGCVVLVLGERVQLGLIWPCWGRPGDRMIRP